MSATLRRVLSRRAAVKIAATGVAAGLAVACAPVAPTPAPTKPTEAQPAKPGGAAEPAKPAEAAKPAAPTAVAPTTQPAAAAGAPAKTGNFKMPTFVTFGGSDPTTLDPHYGESAAIGGVLGHTLEPLIDFDRKMNPVGILAESWKVLDDKITWRFNLRKNVKFHNGEPFTAEAVKFTVERTMNPDLRAKGLNDPFPSRSGVVKVNVVDANTVDIVLKEPNVILPIFLSFLYILEPKYYASKPLSETSLRPMGTGPWRVTDWVKGDHHTLENFKDYWRGVPPIEKFQYKPVPEAATRLNMLLSGEADLVGGINPPDFSKIEGNANLRISKAPGSRRAHIGIPVINPKYKDRKVRQALIQAMDLDGMAKAILGPLAPAQRRSNVLVSGDGWLNPDLKATAFDPDAAKKTLQSLNYPFNDKTNVVAQVGTQNEEIVQAVAGNLRKIGINAEAQILDANVYTDRMRSDKGIGDLYYSSLGSRFNGPEDVSIVTTGQIWDQTHWSELTENGPKFAATYKELSQTFDEAQQKKMVFEMQRLFMEEAVWASLWILPTAVGVNKRLTWEDSGGGNRFNLWLMGEEPVRLVG